MAGAPDASGAAGVARAMTQWRTLLLQASGRMLDLLLPPQCVCCDAGVEVQGQLCAACFGHTDFITRAVLRPLRRALRRGGTGRRCCRLPRVPRVAAAVRTGAGGAALQCARPPPDPAAEARGNRPELAAVLAPHMARAGADLLRRADLLVPVPLRRAAPVPPPLQPGGPAGSRRCPHCRCPGAARRAGPAPRDQLAGYEVSGRAHSGGARCVRAAPAAGGIAGRAGDCADR